MLLPAFHPLATPTPKHAPAARKPKLGEQSHLNCGDVMSINIGLQLNHVG